MDDKDLSLNCENQINDTGEPTERKEKKGKKATRGDKIFFGIAISLVAIMVAHLLLFTFVFFHVSVAGRSMDKTLTSGDVLIVNKLKQATRGDVVIISNQKENGDWLVKRVIGVEGDTVKIVNGQVYLNGELLIEPYVLEQNVTFAPSCNLPSDVSEQTYVVGENQVFYLGDNREDSLDSRYYGLCLESDVKGVVSEFAIKIKGITTPVNRFILNVKGIFSK